MSMVATICRREGIDAGPMKKPKSNQITDLEQGPRDFFRIFARRFQET
jgi:hypothetical protein